MHVAGPSHDPIKKELPAKEIPKHTVAEDMNEWEEKQLANKKIAESVQDGQHNEHIEQTEEAFKAATLEREKHEKEAAARREIDFAKKKASAENTEAIN